MDFSSKYLITNKVKEVSYKLLHLFYPVKLYMMFFFQILSLYALSVRLKMNLSPIFFGECTYTNLFWKDFFNFCTCFFFTEFIFVI